MNIPATLSLSLSLSLLSLLSLLCQIGKVYFEIIKEPNVLNYNLIVLRIRGDSSLKVVSSINDNGSAIRKA